MLCNPIEKLAGLQSPSCISQKSSEKTSNFCLLGFPVWGKGGKKREREEKKINKWALCLNDSLSLGFGLLYIINFSGSHSLFPLRLRFVQLFVTLTCVREDWCLWNNRLPVFSAVTYAWCCLALYCMFAWPLLMELCPIHRFMMLMSSLFRFQRLGQKTRSLCRPGIAITTPPGVSGLHFAGKTPRAFCCWSRGPKLDKCPALISWSQIPNPWLTGSSEPGIVCLWVF